MGSKWMVDAKGSGNASDKTMGDALKDQDFEAFIEKQGGLSAAVQKFAQDRGFVVTDRGGGPCGWHIGVPFDELSAAVPYLDELVWQFAKALACSMLRVELKTWSAEAWKDVV